MGIAELKKQSGKETYRRHYRIGGITIQLEADLPILDTTFLPVFKLFEVEGPGEDTITVRHHFSFSGLNHHDLEEEVYRRPPWLIYRSGDSWVYVGISGVRFGSMERLLRLTGDRFRSLVGRSSLFELPAPKNLSQLARQRHVHMMATSDRNDSFFRIYNRSKRLFHKGNLTSLTLFPTDQILLARVLASMEGCYIHAAGIELDGKGMLFVGHSEAGKSTMVNMLQNRARIFCDDRIIVRRAARGFRIHGTWSHGDVEEVYPGSAPLSSVFFLEQAGENRLIPIESQQEKIVRLLACLIKPLVTAGWWDRTLTLVEKMVQEVPFHVLKFDKSGRVLDLLRGL